MNLSLSSWLTGAAMAGGIAVTLVSACADGEDVDPGFENFGGGDATGSGGATTGVTGATNGPSSGSSSPTAATGVGGATVNGTGANMTTGSACMDSGPGEPNESENAAFSLGEVPDNDGEGANDVSGVITDQNDVDWYEYHGVDGANGVVDPTRDFVASDALRLCKFAVCDDDDDTNIDCPGGTTSATSPNGAAGCCGFAGFEMDLNCAGGINPFDDDSATVYMRVDNPNGATCATYTINYHY